MSAVWSPTGTSKLYNLGAQSGRNRQESATAVVHIMKGVDVGESQVPYAYNYLNPTEIRFLDAAVERLIPTDELGPGGRDAGCTCYIDRALCSTWGSHGRNYRSGPWPEGTPEQGFQSRFTPQEIYRIGILE